jgi:hypothetical protein
MAPGCARREHGCRRAAFPKRPLDDPTKPQEVIDILTKNAPRDETIDYTVADGVATITLNRPDSLNAWTRQLGEEMIAALDAAAADPAVRVVAITGAGRVFSSGADTKSGGEFRDDGTPDVVTPLRDAYNPLSARVRTLPKPVVAWSTVLRPASAARWRSPATSSSRPSRRTSCSPSSTSG